MAEIYMYNLNGRKAIEIKNICRALNVSYREIEKSEYSLKLSNLLGFSGDNAEKAGENFDEEMLYLIGFSDGLLTAFLRLLRSRKCAVALKAVMTETNVGYTSFELFNEISAEHKIMHSGE